PASAAFESALLDALSTVRTSGQRSLGPGLAALRDAVDPLRGGDGLVIAVFGALDAAEAHPVAGARRGTATCIAVLVDVHLRAGRPAPDAPTAAAVFRSAGWRVITIDSAAALSTAWARADAGRKSEGLT